jgi:hypothetical protein
MFICVIEVMHSVYVFFKRFFDNRARSELKYKRGMKEHVHHWHCIIYRNLLLSPFVPPHTQRSS